VDDGMVTGDSLLRCAAAVRLLAIDGKFRTEFTGAYFYGHGEDPAHYMSADEISSLAH
jgi:hypothetical protein